MLHDTGWDFILWRKRRRSVAETMNGDVCFCCLYDVLWICAMNVIKWFVQYGLISFLYCKEVFLLRIILFYYVYVSAWKQMDYWFIVVSGTYMVNGYGKYLLQCQTGFSCVLWHIWCVEYFFHTFALALYFCQLFVYLKNSVVIHNM